MKTWKCVFVCLLAISFMLAASAPGFAQSLTGTLRGVVLDQQGRVVPDATITLTSGQYRDVRHHNSSSAGTYSIPNLPSASYKIKVDASGFASYLRTGIQVLSSQVTEVVGEPGSSKRNGDGARGVRRERFADRELADQRNI